MTGATGRGVRGTDRRATTKHGTKAKGDGKRRERENIVKKCQHVWSLPSLTAGIPTGLSTALR